MNNKQLIEKARGLYEKASPAPWNVGNETDESQYQGKNAVYNQSHGIIAERAVYYNGDPKLNEFDEQTFRDMEFIARSRTLIPELTAALEKAEQDNRWISVEEDVPPYGVEVDVVRNGKVEIGWMDEVMVFTHDYTHWRKRPEPPKGD